MGSVNVNRNVSDVFYRYKMPRIIAKVEGKGNGIKTVIVNMHEIAKALGRPATYPTKYFGCELGAQTQMDYKNDRFIVNGAHDASKLQTLLDGFIRKFVLCPECENPETDLQVNVKKMTIGQGCKACGYHGLIETTHKLNTYILKNPPNVNPGVQGASLTEKKKRGGKRGGKKVNGEGDDHDSGEHRSDSPDEQLDHSVSTQDNGGEDDEGEWAVDCSEEAVKARLQDLTEGAKGLTLVDDLDKTEKERMDIFYRDVEHRLASNTLTAPQQAKEVLSLADRLEVKSKAPLVLAELLFDTKIRAQIRTYRGLLLRFTHKDPKAQKYLIGGIEKIISIHSDTLLPQVPAIFKVLYDCDIVEEGVILTWASKRSKRYVGKEMCEEIHTKLEPFIKWLQEAEEEEESSSDEDDLQIEYDDRAKASPLKDMKPSVVTKEESVTSGSVATEDQDGEDDVDIDAI